MQLILLVPMALLFVLLILIIFEKNDKRLRVYAFSSLILYCIFITFLTKYHPLIGIAILMCIFSVIYIVKVEDFIPDKWFKPFTNFFLVSFSLLSLFSIYEIIFGRVF